MQNQIMQNVKTMSSREIAGLCSKEHRHVLRDIDDLNATYEEMALPKVGRSSYTADNGQSYREFLLTQEQTIDLMTGYNRNLRIRINRRWQELEAQTSQPAIPQSFSEALLLAGKLQQQIEQNAPKVAHYDAVADRKTLLNATQVAQSVGLKSPQSLNARLDKIGVYNKAIKRGRAFKAWFVEQGLGEMKQGNTGHMQPLFTTKGQIWVFELLSREVVQ